MEKVDYSKELIETARKICTPGKGILAADESPGSVAKKFDVLKIENVEENRRRYREMLLTSAGIEDYISGVILQEETAKQATKDGKLFITYLQDRGIVAGIKVKLERLRSTRDWLSSRAIRTRRTLPRDWMSWLLWLRSSTGSDAGSLSGEQS